MVSTYLFGGHHLAHRVAEIQDGIAARLPTADVGYAVTQVWGQLSGGEIARPTGAGRPNAEIAVMTRPPDSRRSTTDLLT